MWAYARPFSKLREAADSWSIFDSENHDAEAESFFFLAAQIFEGLPAYRNRVYADGSTVAQQYKAWRAHWSTYIDERAKRGLFIETAAPTYAGYTVESLLNVYDFAADPVLRRKAGMLLDLEFADYAQHELRDVWGGAKSRSYPSDSYNGADDTLTILGRQLFGPTTAVTGNNHALALATSGYYPPPVVVSLATGHAGLGSYTDVVRRPGNGPKSFDPNDDWHVTPSKSVVDYAYCTPDYILGTAELKPGDSHIAPSSQNRWQGIIFNSTAGDRVYPQAAPSNVSPTNDAFLSIQNKFVLITEKMAYSKQPTFVYFPITLDSVVEKHGWVFVREGSAYLAVRPAIGTYKWLTPTKNKASNRQSRFIQLSKSTAPIVFEAGRAGSYASFGAFQSRIIANRLVYAGGALDYTAANGTHFTMYSDTTKAPKVNGQPPNYAPAKVFNSPFMQSVWGSGKITIKRGAQSATYDFSQPANPTETVRVDLAEHRGEPLRVGHRRHVPAVEAHDCRRPRQPADHLLLHRRRNRTVALVEHVRHRHARDGRPTDRLEVVVHRVGHAADGIHHERQRVVVERVAAVGAPEGLGILGRRGQGDHGAAPPPRPRPRARARRGAPPSCSRSRIRPRAVPDPR